MQRMGGARPRPVWRRAIQQPQSQLAMLARVGTELERELLRSAVGPLITGVNGPEILPYALPFHRTPPPVASMGYIADGLTA